MTDFLFRELRSIAYGAKLGQGSARKTYVLRINPSYVIKVERTAGSFQNVAEWETWRWLQDDPIAKWLAPCEQISSCGSMLVQRRVEPARDADLPTKIPAFLCDLKLENFGFLDGRFVCCDYGTVQSSIRKSPQHLVKAEWRK